MKRHYFGTDGVRGPYGGPIINEDFASRLGAAVAQYLGRTGQQVRALIGRDTRASGLALEQAITVGLLSEGATVFSAGVLPTPALAAAMDPFNATLGVMITASHNPAGDNGIKFFTTGGFKLSDAEELEIERLLPTRVPVRTALPGEHADATSPYCRRAEALLEPRSLTGWKIVLDTAHGATAETSARVLATLGAEIVQLGGAPSGSNINEGVGSEHPEALAAKVVEMGARLGIAHDGDGDRCVLCDERGDVLDGDEILAILGVDALERGTLLASTLVCTVQSNLGLDAAITRAGGRVVRSQVGDRYVLELMRKTGATLGGESSGHIISLDSSTTGDGLVAALKVMRIMVATGKPLSDLRRAMKKFPQATDSVRVREKKDIATLAHLPAAIATLESEMGAAGRVLVRYSGTEPKLRFLVEGPTQAIVEDGIQRLVAAARKDLDVV